MLLTENRKLETENNLNLYRIRSGPLAESSENITAYSQDAPGSKRHNSGAICGFSKGSGTICFPAA